MARMKLRRVGLTGQAATLGLLALCGTAAPLTWETGPYAPGYLAVAIAHADSGRGGDDGGDSGRGGDDDGGRSDSSGSDDGDGSGSGSGRDRDGGDDGSGSDSSGDDGGSSGSGSLGGGDDSGSGGGDDGDGRGGDDDSGSDGDDDGSGSGSGGSGGDDGRDAGRPRATVELDDRDVAAVLRGERVLVDDLGRVLELELEIEHGRRTVTVKPHGGDFKRSPGPIGEVHSIPAAGVPASRVVVDRRTGALEVEVEHGVAVTKPHGGGRPAGLRDPVQVGSDLTSAEEAALIQGGWR
jgi:hypothetical protein